MKAIVLSVVMATALAGCASAAPEPDTTCGLVNARDLTPTARNIFPVDLDAIDGENRVARELNRLPPGEHTLKVYERIADSRLRVAPRNRGESQLLTITVAPDKVYYLGAEFIPAKRYSLQNDYWRPVIWKEESSVCHP